MVRLSGSAFGTPTTTESAVESPQLRKRLLIALCGLTALLLAAHALAFDGIIGFAWSVALPDDTVFAAGYSAIGFLRVHSKMSRDEVRGLLGDPLQVRTDEEHREFWLYARSPKGSNFRVRTVIFGADGLVVQRMSEFYVD